MSKSQKLFAPYRLGVLELKNRVVMAPMTRSRAIGNIPNSLMAVYYGQRAEAGLIVTEGTSPSPNGLGYARIPGLFNNEQMRGWQKVAQEVHAEGSRIFVQLMHTGRISHPLNQPKGARVLAPSPIAAPGSMYTDQEGLLPHPVPVEMSEKDIEDALQEFVRAAELARQAGIDGVELHGANGYLIDQFLNTATNQRDDRWGGSVENRIRFAVEVAKRVGQAIGFDRVGFRISPFGTFNGLQSDPQMPRLYERLTEALSRLGVAYLHLVAHPELESSGLQAGIRSRFKNSLIIAGGYTHKRAEAELTEGRADLIAFGRPFISNPRLVTKWKNSLPLLEGDGYTFYTPGEKGYIDYPLGA